MVIKASPQVQRNKNSTSPIDELLNGLMYVHLSQIHRIIHNRKISENGSLEQLQGLEEAKVLTQIKNQPFRNNNHII